MVELRDDLRLALDRVSFTKACGIEPDEWQRNLLRSGSKRILINASRQSGKSTITAILALHRALYYSGSLILILAPALRQSQELYAKLADYHATLGYPLKAYGERRLSLELTNGSRVVTLPGSERTVRGYSGVSLLIVDEAARVDDSLYFATRPMLAASGGSLVMLSTPYGKRGVFYEAWEDGGNEWQRFEVPATDVPWISPKFLAEERGAIGDWWYRQEYFCEFLDTPDQFFSTELIESMISSEVEPLRL